MLGKLWVFLMRLLCFGMLGIAVTVFVRSLMHDGSRQGAVSALFDFLCISLTLALVSGILFWRYCVGPFVDSIVEKIFWNSTHLKKTPLALTSFYGGLSKGAYLDVWREMRELPAKEFRDPEVVYLFAQACMNLNGYEQEGIAAMETFFRRVWGKEYSADVLKLLLYYADTALAFRSPAEVGAVFEKALKKYRFAGHEKKAARARMDVLKKMENV